MLAEKSHLRTAFTSKLVGRFIGNIGYRHNSELPALSEVHLKPMQHFEVLVVKYFTFLLVIKSPRIQLRETNAHNIVSKKFDLLWQDPSGSNLPLDYRKNYEKLRKTLAKKERKYKSGLGADKSDKQDAEKAKEDTSLGIAGMKRKQREGDENSNTQEQKKSKIELGEQLHALQAQAKRVLCDFIAGMTDS